MGPANGTLQPVVDTCRIFYSTQSGRAKSCARRSARLLSQLNIVLSNGKGISFDQDQASLVGLAPDLQALSGRCLLLLFVSTTGDGEHTDSIQRTWKQLLQKSLCSDLFHGVPMAIFSLGDRAYGPKFCVAGRKLMARMRQLGATLFVEPGYGDDGTPSGGVYADLDTWLQGMLIPKLISQSSGNPAIPVQLTAPPTAEPPYHVLPAVSFTGTEQMWPDRRGGTLEWQTDECIDAYRSFFQSRAPLTAYEYDWRCNKPIDRQICSTGSSIERGETVPLMARVLENRRITSDHCEQDTRHLRFELNMSLESTIPRSQHRSVAPPTLGQWNPKSIPFRAGDVAVILPYNSPNAVNSFLQVLPIAIQAVADCIMSIKYSGVESALAGQFPGVGYPYWPEKCTLRGWLTYCADIQALPEREDLRALSSYCADNSPQCIEQRKKLVSLSEPKDSALYVDYILREKRSWSDVLFDFDSLKREGSLLTVGALLGLLSPIRPRDFSIASSPTKDWIAQCLDTSDKPPGFRLDLCVAVVEGVTRRGRSFHGLCSKFLSQLPISSSSDKHEYHVPTWIRPGSFHGLPLKCTDNNLGGKVRPVMFVGAGTGVAPLRAMIQEREAVRSLGSDTVAGKVPDVLNRSNTLVFGCRMSTGDFYYENEWKLLEANGRISLLVAFSRDQRHKVYVQDVLESSSFGRKQIARHLLENCGAIYIAGGPKMARTVKELILKSLAEELPGGQKDAHNLLSQLERKGLYCVEAWS